MQCSVFMTSWSENVNVECSKEINNNVTNITVSLKKSWLIMWFHITFNPIIISIFGPRERLSFSFNRIGVRSCSIRYCCTILSICKESLIKLLSCKYATIYTFALTKVTSTIKYTCRTHIDKICSCIEYQAN